MIRIVAATVGIWVLGTVLLAALVWNAVQDAGVATGTDAVAATVQAATAVLVAMLTVWLALTGDRAQRAAENARAQAQLQAAAAQDSITLARRQVELSEAADRNARRDRQLLAVPAVAVGRIGLRFRDEDDQLTLFVPLENISEHRAYRVRIEIRGMPDRRGDLSPHFATASLDTLGSQGVQVPISVAEFRNVSAPVSRGWDPHDATTYPWFEILVRFEGVLGQVVTQRHLFWAAHQPEPVAEYETLRIDTSVDGAEPFEARFSA